MKRFLRSLARGTGAALALVSLAGPAPAATATQGSPAAATAAPVRAGSARDNYDGPPLLLGNDKKVKIGGYGSMGAAYTRMMGRHSGLVSLEAALLLDHRLSLGVAGYGFTRTPRGPDAVDGTRQQFGAGYGGLALRYALFAPGVPVYGSFGLTLGAGAINLHRDERWDDEASWDDGLGRDDHDWDAGRFDPFLFAQPELALNANATRWLRLGASVGYRFTGGVGRFGLGEADLNGVVAGANIALGWL